MREKGIWVNFPSTSAAELRLLFKCSFAAHKTDGSVILWARVFSPELKGQLNPSKSGKFFSPWLNRRFPRERSLIKKVIYIPLLKPVAPFNPPKGLVDEIIAVSSSHKWAFAALKKWIGRHLGRWGGGRRFGYRARSAAKWGYEGYFKWSAFAAQKWLCGYLGGWGRRDSSSVAGQLQGGLKICLMTAPLQPKDGSVVIGMVLRIEMGYRCQAFERWC